LGAKNGVEVISMPFPEAAERIEVISMGFFVPANGTKVRWERSAAIGDGTETINARFPASENVADLI
jgi:hypothetical protein